MARRIAQIEWFVGAVLLITIVILVFVASIMRFFRHPLIWSVDLAQLLFIWLCFVGATRAMRERAHLGVDLLVRLLPHRARLAIELVLGVVFIVFMIVLAKVGYDLALLNRERLFGDSGLSYIYVTLAVPVGCLFLSVAIVANGAEAWLKRSGGDLLVFSRVDIDGDGASEL